MPVPLFKWQDSIKVIGIDADSAQTRASRIFIPQWISKANSKEWWKVKKTKKQKKEDEEECINHKNIQIIISIEQLKIKMPNLSDKTVNSFDI